MSAARRRLAVLMGGRSSEHEISIASARSVIEALDPARYEVVIVEIARDGRWEIGPGSALPALYCFDQRAIWREMYWPGLPKVSRPMAV